jgi:hypothetical protein
VAAQMAQQPLGHLAAGAVVGTHEQHAWPGHVRQCRFYSSTAWGLVSQAGGGDTLVTPINLVNGNLGTRLCLNSSCT